MAIENILCLKGSRFNNQKVTRIIKNQYRKQQMNAYLYYSVTITTALWLLLRHETGYHNPIKQAAWLNKNRGIAKGIILVSLIFLVGGHVTKSNASEYKARISLGLDQPFDGISQQCTDRHIGSNIRVQYMPIDYLGVLYRHESCAAGTDRNSVDELGLTFQFNYQRLYFNVDAAWDEFKNDSQAISAEFMLLDIEQYQFSLFIQRKNGILAESIYGAYIHWNF